MRFGNPVVNSVTAPVFGFTRQMVPASGAVTYNALSGPPPDAIWVLGMPGTPDGTSAERV